MDTTIKNLQITQMGESNFIKPFSIKFDRGGMHHKWDCIKVHDSVSILLFHKEKNAFLIVKQFRPSLWYHESQAGENYDELGYSYELCAGILDKNKSFEQTAIEEVEEELGYKIPHLEYVTATFGALGFGASKQYVFFAEISEDMRISEGGGVDGEVIEPVWVPLQKAREFIYDEKKPKASGLIFAFLWYMTKKEKVC